MDKNIFKILPLVSKPSRYIGAELNSCLKDPAAVKLRLALCFPDVYEVGFSHLGLKVLYKVLNARADIYAERAYSPWGDMERMLVEKGIQLGTVETGAPLGSMDIVGFTLQYELSYTNMLNMLSLSGIPPFRTGRDGSHPLVIAGGPCALNPEPVSDFIDAFVIGDAEEAVLEVADAVIRHKDAHGHGNRDMLLATLSKIEGVYVPAHFEVVHGADGSIEKIKNTTGGPDKVSRRTVKDLDSAAYPAKPLVPYLAAVHNRITLEISRGCTRGCRFCQAGYIYRPVRERSRERIMELAGESICSTGYDEVSLSSLSAGDYSHLLPLMKSLMDRYESERVSISLPSLRVGTLTGEMCREIKRVRKTGFTIAPEAGSQRLRDTINKDVTEEALVETAETVFREGWDLIKLYFMTGLPTETDEDLEGIISLSKKVLDAGKKAGGRRKGVNVGVSAFVPKPHTPFQWRGQIPLPEILRRKELLKRVLGKRPFAMKTGLAEMSVLEAAFARGGRGLGRAIHNAWKRGARFDGWTEFFDYALWKDSFAEAGLDLEAEAMRDYPLDAVLPWDHIETGVTKKYLKKELDLALKAAPTGDCRTKCTGCGLKCRPEGSALTPTPLPAGEGNNIDTPLPSMGKSPCYPLHLRERVAQSAGRGLPGGIMPSARIRIRYSKEMPLAMLSHAELMGVFFRAIARAGLPVAFSEGFNPHQKLSFGPALATGIESEAEILDIELSYAIDLITVVKKLNHSLPGGINVLEARVLREGEPAAGVGITSFTYEAAAPDGWVGDIKQAVGALIARESVLVTRVSDKGAKEIEIRPMIASVEVMDKARGAVRFTLKEANGRSAKPFELVQALYKITPADAKTVKVRRTGLV